MIIRKITIKDIINNEMELKVLLKEILEIKFEKCENKLLEVYNNMERFVEDGSAILIGAFEKEKVIGFIWAYKIKEKTYHINYFAVNKNNRRLGVGQKLLDKLYEIAKENKIGIIELFVEAHNENAIKKYKKNEFEEKYIKMEKNMGSC